MADLQLERVSTLTEPEVAHCDFSFKISSEVAKPLSQLALEQPFTTSPLPERTKDFGFDDEYFENADGKQRVLFVLKKDDTIFGYSTASRGWNNMVHLDYICLDASIRGNGNAMRLLNAVREWTREIGLKHIRIEGQSNNVSACRFYKKAGLVFGGYDEYLFRAIPENSSESAVFFYDTLDEKA
jgi:streptothricin acetyltransferase